ncbi:hypothetical protein LPC10_22225 [Methylorubrum sp. B1-46]|uniref:hypothetical protein n=1 Tax=Methylorubrum sp. B1-46 TaxID=2897334 RepID=UPI001E534363|nr:hypothetical protein [Methylorubrum sp. B1-46]UGB25574.1 hypothetical protein LPC10_22225 [Methylorubrum sp. B1-46]
MADQAHSTPAPKIIASGGPVSAAITAGRGECDPIAAIREGLEEFFAGIDLSVDFDAPVSGEAA